MGYNVWRHEDGRLVRNARPDLPELPIPPVRVIQLEDLEPPHEDYLTSGNGNGRQKNQSGIGKLRERK